jgi:hypothetical protein
MGRARLSQSSRRNMETTTAATSNPEGGGTTFTFNVSQLGIVFLQLGFFTLAAYYNGKGEHTRLDRRILLWVGFWEMLVLAVGIALHVRFDTGGTEASSGRWMIFTAAAILVFVFYRVVPYKRRRSTPPPTMQDGQQRVFTVDLERGGAPPPTYKSMYGEEGEQPPDYSSDAVHKY